MMLRFHVEYVDPAIPGEDVELDIVDPSAILNDERGLAGPMLAGLRLHSEVRRAYPIRRPRPDDYLPHNRLSRSLR